MRQYKKLLDNSIIFAIGLAGSKILSIILVPIYTHHLSTNEYGFIDLIVTSINLLIPIISLGSADAIFRFTMEKNSTEKKVVTNIIAIIFASFTLFLLTIPIAIKFSFFNGKERFLYALVIIQILYLTISQFTRATGRLKLFASSGILLTFSLGALNILFIVFLKKGIDGYLLSIFLSFLISIFYLIVRGNFISFFDIKQLNKKFQITMLKYSAPLIPNTLMWWFINSSSRFAIGYFSGLEANGLYAVSTKIPSLLNIVNEVFTQAWQMNVIEDKENSSSIEYYTTIFNTYSQILFISISFILALIKLMFNYVFNIKYFEAWKAVPFLCISTMFSALSGFLGAAYLAEKNTKNVFTTSLWGGAISLMFNLILIPKIGFVGASISSLFSFLVMFLIRYKDIGKKLNININYNKMILNMLIIFIQTITLFLNLNLFIESIVQLILFILILIVNIKLIKKLTTNILKIFI